MFFPQQFWLRVLEVQSSLRCGLRAGSGWFGRFRCGGSGYINFVGDARCRKHRVRLIMLVCQVQRHAKATDLEWSCVKRGVIPYQWPQNGAWWSFLYLASWWLYTWTGLAAVHGTWLLALQPSATIEQNISNYNKILAAWQAHSVWNLPNLLDSSRIYKKVLFRAKFLV